MIIKFHFLFSKRKEKKTNINGFDFIIV